MRILVGSKNAWNDMNAVGNTLSNWFGNQEGMEFSSLYSRAGMPANRICNDYYRITEIQILKNLLTPENIGSHFTLDFDEMDFSAVGVQNKERKAIDFIKSHSLKSVYSISDKLWKSEKWVNQRLRSYIKDFNPDIFFSFATDPSVLKIRMSLLKELCSAKCVLYVADDVYSALKAEHNARETENFEWCMANADLLYGASPELCREYAAVFGREFSFLCKGCEIREVADAASLSTIRLVYSGNLYYGRDETLARLIQAVKQLNEKQSCNMFVEIYTTSPVSEEMKKRLNVDGAGKIMGARAYSEITEIMHSADIALLVESFEKDDIEKVRLSFSTKISDCLQSGSAVMAIGPDGISSVEYLKGVDGSYVITDISKLGDVLSEIAENPKDITRRARAVNCFAERNHGIATVRERIKKDFVELIQK